MKKTRITIKKIGIQYDGQYIFIGRGWGLEYKKIKILGTKLSILLSHLMVTIWHQKKYGSHAFDVYDNILGNLDKIVDEKN